jgi:hypothetical protein
MVVTEVRSRGGDHLLFRVAEQAIVFDSSALASAEQKGNRMLDVHAPHGSAHGWRDFLFHLLTITAGLFIALSLESGVQWLHHRHLAHEAEASLDREVRVNAKALEDTAAALPKYQENLKADITLLNQFLKTHKLPKNSRMQVNVSGTDLENLSWTTAQSTGAVSYMSYATARDYAEIYTLQTAIDSAEKQAARDATLCIGPFSDLDESDMTRDTASTLKERIQVLQGQLVLVNTFVSALNDAYKRYLNAHPS